jgi:DNA-directed RNA polymerase specialized sigma subunit
MASDKSIFLTGDIVMLTKKEVLSMLKTVKKPDMRDTAAVELHTRILSALNRLPYMQKIIIHSYYFDGGKWAWIATKNGISERQCLLLRNKAVDALVLDLNNKVN